MPLMRFLVAGYLLLALPNLANAATDTLVFKDGDHISILGNALADRMQHDGWLETLMQAQFPDRHLSIRNLGFAGDELTTRMRCENYGSPDDWLSRTKADVVFAFFGYNESFAGPGGLEQFKQNLAKFIKNLGEHKYNSNAPPRLVLFSPIAQENLHTPNLPDGSANDQNLKLYTQAMREVATEHEVSFVDLFASSLDLYAKSSKPLTINGVHLTEYGNQSLVRESYGKATSEISTSKVSRRGPCARGRQCLAGRGL